MSERKPPDGGWDWDKVRIAEETQKGYLGLSIWGHDDRLMGLASMRCNELAAVVRFMEADPRPRDWQRGLIGLVVARVAAIYAQTKERDQIWFWDVSNARLAQHYCESLEMERDVLNGTVYCWRNST